MLRIFPGHSLYPVLSALQKQVDDDYSAYDALGAEHSDLYNDFVAGKLSQAEFDALSVEIEGEQGEISRRAYARLSLPGNAELCGFEGKAVLIDSADNRPLAKSWLPAIQEARALSQARLERRKAAMQKEFFSLQGRAKLKSA